MKIIVCVKQVPEVTEVKIDPKTNTLIRDGVPSIVNPFDEIAVEEAVRLKEKHGGEVTVITMGPPQARQALLRCLAMGADKAILLTDRAFAGSDTWATAYTLAQAIKKMEYDLILCGARAIDGDTAQVGPELAENLGITPITYAKKVEIDPEKKRITVHRETEEGYEVIESRLPVLLTAIKGLNEPRIPALREIMLAKKKEIKELNLASIGGDPQSYGLSGSFTEVVRIFTPKQRGGGIIIKEEDPALAAKKLAQLLLEEPIIKKLKEKVK
ncbi:MAG: electron transfer flavoprotein subunit beta/FixA family protein [Candidatus Freyarchaeota archaeon]|nr:electron transfer flavoprotein subunit beta/FixA family protein [Candidatus Jordarchaeia archaeon]MBS7281353.1 electron transfer flavoprotein subunit beta/FixA family protein [Candidatus Jordarchaeia archaeon]